MKDFYKIEKVCGFYVSNIHFATMILPFINKKLKENSTIYTFFELNLKTNIKKVLDGVIGTLEDKEKILLIDWEDTKDYKYLEIEKKLKKITKGNNVILVCGSEYYIKIINKNINKFLEKNSKKIEEAKIELINCFEVNNFSENIKEILDEHDKVINTSGKHEIDEIFEGYKKKII